MPGPWPTTSSAGWPTSRCPPGASRWRGGPGGGRGGTGRRSPSLAASVLVALAGTAAVLAVQTRANGRPQEANVRPGGRQRHVTKANADLKSANEREKQRFDLAMEAIKLFHGEVGDDLVLKADQFKPLRDKLLRGAADFYGKLEGLLKDQPDRASRAAMGNAYFELGELTAKIGDKPAALAAHRKGLASVVSWPRNRPPTPRPAATWPGACIAAAILLRRDGRFGRRPSPALRRHASLLEGLPALGPGFRRPPRSARSDLHVDRGLAREHRETGRGDAGLPAVGRDADRGWPTTYPAVTEFRSRAWRTPTTTSAFCSCNLAEPTRRWSLTGGRWRSSRSWPTTTPPSPTSEAAWRLTHQQHRLSAVGNSQASRGTRVVSARVDDPAEAGRLTTPPSPNSAGASPTASTTSALCNRDRPAGRGDGVVPPRPLVRQKLADDNPAVADFRSRLADSHTGMGWLLMQIGRPAAAVAEFAREESIRMKLVGEHPSLPIYQDRLANCQTNEADRAAAAWAIRRGTDSSRASDIAASELGQRSPRSTCLSTRAGGEPTPVWTGASGYRRRCRSVGRLETRRCVSRRGWDAEPRIHLDTRVLPRLAGRIGRSAGLGNLQRASRARRRQSHGAPSERGQFGLH